MHLAPELLGATTVRQLEETQSATVLAIGSDTFTRRDLAKVACFNFHAARNLTHVFKELQVPNLKHVYEHLPPAALAVPGLGVIALAVLGAAFEAKRIGGENPLASYAAKHAQREDGTAGTIVTFDTLKAHAKQREAEAKPRRRRGGRGRR